MVVCITNCCYYSFIRWYKHPLEKSETPTVHFLINKNIFLLLLYVICVEVSFASSPIRVFSCIIFFSFLNFYNRNLSLHNIPRTTTKSPEKINVIILSLIFFVTLGISELHHAREEYCEEPAAEDIPSRISTLGHITQLIHPFLFALHSGEWFLEEWDSSIPHSCVCILASFPLLLI